MVKKDEPKNKGGRPTKHQQRYKNTGRPTKMTETTVMKFEEGLLLGMTIEMACLFADISKQTYYEYCKKNPDYNDRVKILRTNLGMKATAVVANDIQQGDVKVSQWYLERRHKEDYGNNIDVTSDGEIIQPVNIIDFLNTDKLVQDVGTDE